MHLFNAKKTFTLIEMLIVVVIIGILVGALTVTIQWAQWRANYVSIQKDLTDIGNATQLYYMENGTYPKDLLPWAFPPELHGYISYRPQPICKKMVYDWNIKWPTADFPPNVTLYIVWKWVVSFYMVNEKDTLPSYLPVTFSDYYEDYLNFRTLERKQINCF